MKRWIMMLSALIAMLGASACNSNEFPAAVTAGFVHPVVSLIPTNKQPSASPTSFLVPTETIVPTSFPQPSASPTPLIATTMVCQENTGRIEEHQLESDLLDDPLEYLVYFPACYSEQLERNYPVLYLIHGQTYTHWHWINLGAVDIADHMISGGDSVPFMMVFPYDRDHYNPPTNNPFGQVVLLELIPAVDSHFRTIPTRARRAIGGISRGGNWAAHISLQQPQLFNAIGLHSTPIFSTDTNKEIIEWLEAIPNEEYPLLYLDIGEKDRWLRYTLVFEELLNNASIPHEWHLYPGFHEDEYWESHLEEYIRWYTLPWSAESQ